MKKYYIAVYKKPGTMKRVLFCFPSADIKSARMKAFKSGAKLNVNPISVRRTTDTYLIETFNEPRMAQYRKGE